jgi:hypothetical protein
VNHSQLYPFKASREEKIVLTTVTEENFKSGKDDLMEVQNNILDDMLD